MDPFERYHFNLMISHEPLAANGNNFGEWFHALMDVLWNANMDHFVSHMPGDEVHEGPHHQCEVCVVKELMHTCIDVELVERFCNHHPYHLVERIVTLELLPLAQL